MAALPTQNEESAQNTPQPSFPRNCVNAVHPLSHSLSDVNISWTSVAELEERMTALQQAYQRQQQNLMMHFKQSQTQLALQHLQYAQQLFNEYIVQRQMREQQQQASEAAALELRRLTQETSRELAASNRHCSAEFSNISASQPAFPPPSMNSGPNELLNAASSGAISNETKERLRQVIFNKRKHRQPLQSVGSSTPSDDPTILDDDYQLRKASSEPNLKMRGVIALRAKLQNRSSPKLPQAHYRKPPLHHTVGPYAEYYAAAAAAAAQQGLNAGRHLATGTAATRERNLLSECCDETMDMTGSNATMNTASVAGVLKPSNSANAALPTGFQNAPNTMLNVADNLMSHQIFKPQPLYSSPSLPDMSSSNVMRQMALQKTLSVAAAAHAFEQSAAAASLLNAGAGLANPFASLSAAASADPMLFRSLSGLLGTQDIGGNAIPITSLPPSVTSPCLTSGLPVVAMTQASHDAAAHLSKMSSLQHGLQFAPVTAASLLPATHAFRPLDRRTTSSPLPLAQGTLASAMSQFVDPSLLAAASKAGSSDASGSQASNNALKEQLRDIIMRRKSLVREETEDEVEMDVLPGQGQTGRNVIAYPSLRTMSNPLPGLQQRNSGKASGLLLGKHGLGSSGQDAKKRFPATPEDAVSGVEKLNKQSRASALSGTPESAVAALDSAGTVMPSPGTLTGIVYDTLMCKHQCLCNDNKQCKHLEHSGRIQSIWARLQETSLVGRCERLQGRKVPVDTLKLVHTENYANFFGTSAACRAKLNPAELPVKSFTRLACGGVGVDADTYFNDNSTSVAARMAVGCSIELCRAILEGRVRNGFAIVRPPGSHAEPEGALGFCYFNNVAIAVRYIQRQFGKQKDVARSPLIHKIAIVDWDVHHGNGTQVVFYDDPSVLYISLHRHDGGNFFPGSGAVSETGVGEGKDFNVNIAWSGDTMGDVEYLAAWRNVVDPILSQFQPDFVIVSCGFDATRGHANALGGYHVSPSFFGYATQQLGKFAHGRVALVLEGGYDLTSVCDCAAECTRVLCGDEPTPFSEATLSARPNQHAIDTMRSVIERHQSTWNKLHLDVIELSHREWDAVMQTRYASIQLAALSVAAAVAQSDSVSAAQSLIAAATNAGGCISSVTQQLHSVAGGSRNGPAEADRESVASVKKEIVDDDDAAVSGASNGSTLDVASRRSSDRKAPSAFEDMDQS